MQNELKHVQQIQATDGAFAALLSDGSIVTWGSASSGGDSSHVQDQLKDVQQIQATGSAFAAILGNAAAVSWTDHDLISSAVQEQLKNVQEIQATAGAFAAILSDGTIVPWGPAFYGGYMSEAVQDQLKTCCEWDAPIPEEPYLAGAAAQP